MSPSQSLSMIVNQNILEMEYAVRGPIPQRAAELRKQGRITIPCNIGNPQALGQKPITFYRQVLSLVEEPTKIKREKKLNKIVKNNVEGGSGFKRDELYSDYILNLSETILTNMENGLGPYSESKGPQFIREAVARYIDKRDQVDSGKGIPSNPDHIFITNGASEGAKFVIDMLISSKSDGIMIPIPQYPLYSATIKKSGGTQVNYYPDEDSGWTFDKSILDDSLLKAKREGITVKGIVVINPANPTGAILDKKTIQEVIKFAIENKLVIIADEVYQENLYGGDFFSFAQVVYDQNVPLFSLHSISKGFYGECGHRGGYLEVRNAPMVSGTNLRFTDVLLKQASVSICSNTVGQILTYLMVSPPEKNSEPYERFVKEKEAILDELYEKATIIKDAFKKMDSVECFGKIGAMYLFPRLNKLPKGTTDFDYCMNLLEKTGLTTVNGSGFGQKEGTQHLRIAFLPPKSLLKKVLPEWIDFHNHYVNQ